MESDSQSVATELAELRKDERSLSGRRTRLQNRLDFLRAGGGDADQVAELERQEREISELRRVLHEHIEVVSATLRNDVASQSGVSAVARRAPRRRTA